MKALTIFLLIAFSSLTTLAQVHVSGYTRKDGTYVPPYTRSSPDNNPYNNYGYPGNTNPYTGKVATGNSDTYLYNYYHRGLTSSNTDVVNDRIYLKDNNGYKTGRYLKVFYKNSTSTTYDIYTAADVYDGYVTYLNDGYIRYYGLDHKLIREIAPLESPDVSSLTPNTTPNNYVEIRHTDPPSLPTSLVKDYSSHSERIYLSNDWGYKAGDYAVFISKNSAYKLFNHFDANGDYLGFYTIANNGEVCGYDTQNELISHKPAPKRKK